MTWSPDQENKTVKQCVSGDTQAQEKLYHHYSGLLFSICMRYAPNREMAQDFLQEAFIKAFKSLNRFRFEGSFEGWLKRLTVNSCLDQLKNTIESLFRKILKQRTTSEQNMASWKH